MFQSIINRYDVLRARIIISRVVVGTLVLIQLLTCKATPVQALDFVFWTLGICLIVLAMLGRMWAALFISGKKTSHLVTNGPYSIVRNPLYLSSFLGCLGIGVISGNVSFTILLLTAFLVYYPGVIRAEEENLLKVHGNIFREYKQNVPRILPNFRLYESPERLEIDVCRVLRTARDSLVFLAAPLALLVLNHIRITYLIPAFDVCKLIGR